MVAAQALTLHATIGQVFDLRARPVKLDYNNILQFPHKFMRGNRFDTWQRNTLAGSQYANMRRYLCLWLLVFLNIICNTILSNLYLHEITI